MTMKDFELLQEKLVLTVRKTVSPLDDSGELPFRREFRMELTGAVYDSEQDCYNGISEIHAMLVVYVDKNLGCFSKDERVEMVSAKIRQVMAAQSATFPIPMTVGSRVDICFDSLANMGYIRTVYDRNGRMDFAASGYLRDYDFDGDPVEPLPPMTLDELIEQLKSTPEREEPEELVKRTDSVEPEQMETKAERTKAEERPTPKQPATEQTETETEVAAEADSSSANQTTQGQWTVTVDGGGADDLLTPDELNNILNNVGQATAENATAAEAAEEDEGDHF